MSRPTFASLYVQSPPPRPRTASLTTWVFWCAVTLAAVSAVGFWR